MSLRAVMVGYAMCLLLVIAPPASAAPTWLSPVALSASGQSAEAPAVSVDAAGDAVAAWLRSNGTNTIVEAAGRPAGGTWGLAVELSAAGRNARGEQVAVAAAGDAVAVWSRSDGTNTIIEAASAPLGGTWSAAQPLSAPGRDAEAPEVSVDAAGDAVAAWLRSNGTNTIVEVAARPVGGSWSSPAPLSSAGQNAGEPEVAIDGSGTATVIWTRSNGTNTIVEAASEAAGAWSGSEPLSSAGQNAAEPSLAIDNSGMAVAVWSRSNGTNTIIEAVARPDGAAWSGPQPLSSTGQNASAPGAAIGDNGEMTAVWKRYDGSEPVVEAASARLGGTWSAAEPLSAPGQNAESPQVSIDPAGDAVAVWSRSNGTNTIVEAAARVSGGRWDVPVALSEVGRNAEIPQVQMDQGGDAVVVWQRLDGINTIIQTTALDAAGPKLRSLVMPAAATVRQPVTFSVSPFDVWSPLGLTSWSFGDLTAAAGLAVSHRYSSPGAYQIEVASTDAVGNSTTATATVTIFPKASAKRVARFTGRRALLKLHCPSTVPCRGYVRLIAAVVLSGRRLRHRRRSISAAPFTIPPKAVTAVPLRLTTPGLTAARAAGNRGLKAQLSGEGVKHRLVLLLAQQNR